MNGPCWILPRLAILLLLGGMVAGQTPSLQPLPNPPEGPIVSNTALQRDTFTFVRIKYTVDGTYGMGHNGSLRWSADYPDSEQNLAYRLRQVTSMSVDPDGKVLEITDPALFDYPFIYIVEPGRLTFTPEEVPILRNYLLNGGFLMCDDFWGDREWSNFSTELKRIFPDREPQELPLEHPIFRCVFELKEKPQVPNIATAVAGQATGRTWERGEDTREVHYRAIFDDKGRIMVLLCHNTDLGDGWEKEGENEFYFREFSEKKAYPMGINILFYAMTH